MTIHELTAVVARRMGARHEESKEQPHQQQKKKADHDLSRKPAVDAQQRDEEANAVGVQYNEEEEDVEHNEHTQYTGDVDVPLEAIQVIDPNVVAKLPEGTELQTIRTHGASLWTRTARLDTRHNGQLKRYFLKTTSGARGKDMARGEFTAMSLIHDCVPELAPQPIAWGSYATLSDVHFFLCDFLPLRTELPDSLRFTQALAKLHSTCLSPNGKFGFPVPTYHGNTQLVHGWADSWEEYFSSRTRALLEREREVKGPSQEIDDLADPFFNKVVPRLLRPLETGGRSITPCLVHGDLWDGNVAFDRRTDLPIVFDAASFYAHHEYDLGVWRAEWNKIPQSYMDKYHEFLPASQPEADQDDRNLLYATRVNILDSILYRNDQDYRKKIIFGMRTLVEKYPDGYEGWVREQEEHSPH